MSIVGACAVPHPPLIVPAVGRGDEARISNTIAAYEEVARRIAELKPDTIVIMSPHATAYPDYFHISPGTSARGDFGRFSAPEAAFEVDYDEELAKLIAEEAPLRNVAAVARGERDAALDHGTMVPLHFICKHIPRPRIVRIGLSGCTPLDHYRFGEAISVAAMGRDRRVVFVASGDLSHHLKDDGPYHYAPEGPEFDERICDIFKSGDFGRLLEFSEGFCHKAGECGLRSFITMAGLFNRRAVESELLSYEGPFGVGYGVAWFTPGDYDESRDFEDAHIARIRAEAKAAREAQDPLVALARFSLEYYIRNNREASCPSDIPPDLFFSLGQEELGRKAGVFVSLHKEGRLRGCIGTIVPTQASVAAEVMSNAVSAGLRDPRFHRVFSYELDELVYNVDVLGDPEPIDGSDQLDPKRYGVIVSCGKRRGLLLPDLEGVDTVEEQIDIARRKGRIGADEPYTLERFEVVRHT